MINKIKFVSHSRTILGDMLTPVEIYLRIRDEFPKSIMLESSNYHSSNHNYSYICFAPISKFEVSDQYIKIGFPNEEDIVFPVKDKGEIISQLSSYIDRFEYKSPQTYYRTHGLFGFTSYNAVQYFEDIEIADFVEEDRKIPEILYHIYRFVVVYNHSNDQVELYEHLVDDEISEIDHVANIIQKKSFSNFSFRSGKNEESNFTDEEFLEVIQKGKNHCFRGDVFQIVLSRRFNRDFSGDDFSVYRALRHINPSPYLFYFDFGNFHIFGSSPEAQIVVKEGKATIYPIAGTVKRTGDEEQDQVLTQLLIDDPKENSEHVMLVDLARNDLSNYGSDVAVETFKEVQHYSHVIHLVSKVVGTLDNPDHSLKILASTFPAGTLSGAPKHKALQLINNYEKGCRGYYGGAIGYIDFEGQLDHAIMIRTVLSKGQKLYYQAGAGVVSKSAIESELQEVHNKLMAIRRAIEFAEKL